MNWIQKEMVDPERITMEAFPLTPVLVTTLYDDGRVNIATISYVGVLSEEGKQLIGLAIRPARFTHERIKATRNFGINVPSTDLCKVVNYCGRVSGRDVFKLHELQKFKDEKCRLTLQSSNNIKTPLIAECPINLECKLLTALEFSKEMHACMITSLERSGLCTEKKDLESRITKVWLQLTMILAKLEEDWEVQVRYGKVRQEEKRGRIEQSTRGSRWLRRC